MNDERRPIIRICHTQLDPRIRHTHSNLISLAITTEILRYSPGYRQNPQKNF